MGRKRNAQSHQVKKIMVLEVILSNYLFVLGLFKPGKKNLCFLFNSFAEIMEGLEILVFDEALYKKHFHTYKYEFIFSG